MAPGELVDVPALDRSRRTARGAMRGLHGEILSDKTTPQWTNGGQNAENEVRTCANTTFYRGGGEELEMISELAVRNFKSLRDIHVGLERFTVIVGPNGSGKSSILQALNLLCSTFNAPPGRGENEFSNARTFGTEGSVELAAECAGIWYRYRSAELPPRPTGRVMLWDGNGRAVAADFHSDAWEQFSSQENSSSGLPSSVLLQLEASKLVDPRPNARELSSMAPNGSGLHVALESMHLNDPDSWSQLQEDLQRIVPTIRRLRHTKAVANRPRELLFDTISANSLLASQVSEGTLLVLGLLTALYAPDRPNLILLDDLDRGLHPKAQKDLNELLRRLLETNLELQIVATTHSPYMLNTMEPHEVRMTYLTADGSTLCDSLEKHPKFEKWKDEMAPGEMWSLFGEKWVAERSIAN